MIDMYIQISIYINIYTDIYTYITYIYIYLIYVYILISIYFSKLILHNNPEPNILKQSLMVGYRAGWTQMEVASWHVLDETNS